MKTLEQVRKYWERGRDIVGHWEFPRDHFRVTIMREAHSMEYSLVRYFQIGANLNGVGRTWQTSCDMSCASAPDVFKHLAYLCGGKLEGEE